MSELDPITPEPTDQLTEPTEPKVNRGGRPKKIDWRQRREEIWEKMNAAIDGGAPAPAVIRALQSQLDTCNLAIANEADERQERQRLKELQSVNQETETVPVPTAPPVPAPQTDPENEQRLAKLVKRMEELSEEPPVPEVNPDTKIDRLAVERRAKESAEAARKAAEDLEKKAAEDKRIARIAELKTLRDGIFKARNNPGVMLAAATNPTFLRDGNEGLRAIERELRQLEPQPVGNVPQFDAEEQKRENAARQRAAREERELTDRMLEGERITAANRANARPAPISGGLGMCEGPEWNR